MVVLMSSLPGDVESENAYREQMQTWLEVVANSEARRVIVLCDAPETLPPPAKRGATTLEANRDNFGKLGTMLAGETNGLLVVAWGHGGRQGSLPVFHVRGPRLTPADFQTLAERLPRVESRWILLFRGSGAFASRLAGPGRQVLASEFETPFSSDPVGMLLLLKTVRANPKASIGTLAENLGRATASWYAERHLARTEEPTLWVDNDKPRLLAESFDERSLAEPKTKASATEPEAAALGSDSGELPPAWKRITRVAQENFPGADGVILQRRLSYTLGSAPAVTSEQEEFVQILKPEGKRFGDFDIPYAPPYEELHFLDCEVLRPDGKLARLEPDEIREQRPESAGDYQFGQRKFFSLPGVAPGTVLHVRYRTEWQKFPLPSVSISIPLRDDLPALKTTVQVSLPKDSSFHFALEQLPPTDPAIQQSNYGTTYVWTFDNLPAREREALAPPRQGPQLMISTFPDWSAFAEWYGRISKLADEVTPEIAARAAELTQRAASEREKVIALYNYVVGLRYVAVPLGVNSFRPHAAANVLRNEFGDCKDKANLFNALLHAVKIPAHLVLLPRFSQAYDDLPGLAFNHAISRVLLGGEPLWIDTTDDVCRFGLLPPGDPGRKVLVIDGKTTNLTQLPSPQPSEHQLSLVGTIKCERLEEPLPMSFTLHARGYADYEMRSVAREAKANGAALPLLAARFRPVAGAFALQHQSSTQVGILDADFSSQAEGSWVGGASTNAGKWLLHSPFWFPKQWELALHRRKNPLFLNEGYPFVLEEDFEFILAHKARAEELPAARQNPAGPLRWRAEWARLGDHKLSAKFHIELACVELSMAETADFQKQLRELLAALSSCASIFIPP